MVQRGLPHALVVEDDLVVSPELDLLTALQEQVRRLKEQGCDILKVAPFAVGYLISNSGARKMLSVLQEGSEGILNPTDWEIEMVASQVTNFKRCDRALLFDQYGHGTNHLLQRP
eukprot:CAMPEP_0179164868 /NCGR_PEP_ID=MMETSP0796-20121207/80953_1 /TAXON_ID=73915 /ORGANISM="Pyrodinium bahamense, Strain pbaha01" /LENGTH=114 /DNA_ID=CAMNT_0020867395 /DNA_START=12 /DNA_END=356 /DNA_ORIENTATION=-